MIAFRCLVQAIVIGDVATVSTMLASSMELARERAKIGATRQNAKAHFLSEIEHYLYTGDTALHIAAAAYQKDIAVDLIEKGADFHAKNRRGASPLHYAVDGSPVSLLWNPRAQAATIGCLLKAGADPNCVDQGGVTPLLRAIRNRCALAVQVLLKGGADVQKRNKSGSTPLKLATYNTGRGGSGSVESKAQQEEIVRLLKEYGAA